VRGLRLSETESRREFKPAGEMVVNAIASIENKKGTAPSRRPFASLPQPGV